MVRALNLHPDIFCGMEFLDGTRPHTALKYPGDWLALPSLTENQQRLLGRLVDAKPSPTSIGNKQPRYYLNLHEKTLQIPNLDLLLVYRSPIEFCASWDNRANNQSDNLWSRGQTGLFGIIESLVCMEALLDADRHTLVVPYRASYFSNPRAIEGVFEFLGVQPNSVVLEKFEKSLFRQARLMDKDYLLTDLEQELMSVADTGSLDGLLDRDSPFLFSEAAKGIAAYLKQHKQRSIAQFLSLIPQMSDAEKNYLEIWQKIPRIHKFFETDSITARFMKRLGIRG